MRTRDLNNTGLKAELIARVVTVLEAEDTVETLDAEDTEHDFDEEDRILNGEWLYSNQPIRNNNDAGGCTLINDVANNLDYAAG